MLPTSPSWEGKFCPTEKGIKEMFKGICAAVLVLLTAMTAAAQAETLTFRMQSFYPYTVHFELYSQTRNHVWPGGDQVYVLDDSAQHDSRISCMSGEKICFGAWSSGDSSTYWGVGRGDHDGCTSCCAYCNGGIVSHRLNN